MPMSAPSREGGAHPRGWVPGRGLLSVPSKDAAVGFDGSSRHRRTSCERAGEIAANWPVTQLRRIARRVSDTLVDWLGDLIKDLVREWPAVMAAPLPFLTAVAASLIFGWSAAWLILRQRLIHHKELVESYKEKEAAPKKGSGRARSSQTPPQLIFSTKQMLFGIAVIIAIVAIPSILIISQAKTPNTVMSRIKIGNLSMFTPQMQWITRNSMLVS